MCLAWEIASSRRCLYGTAFRHAFRHRTRQSVLVLHRQYALPATPRQSLRTQPSESHRYARWQAWQMSLPESSAYRDQHAITLSYTQTLHGCRHAHDFLLQLGEGIDYLGIGFGRDEDKRPIIRTFRGMAIHRVVAKVGFASDKPFGKRGTGKIEGFQNYSCQSISLASRPRRHPGYRLIVVKLLDCGHKISLLLATHTLH